MCATSSASIATAASTRAFGTPRLTRAAQIALTFAALMALVEFGYATAHVVEIGGGSDRGSDGWAATSFPWLVVGLLFGLAAERVSVRPSTAQVLAICAAIVAAPRALAPVNTEPEVLWWLRTAACTLAPWLAIVHPATEIRVWLAVANGIVFVLAALLTAYLYLLVPLGGVIGSALLTLPWVIAALPVGLLDLGPKIPVDAMLAAGLGAAIVVRSTLANTPSPKA